MTFETAITDQIAAGVYGVAWLVQLDFAAPTGTVYLSTFETDLTLGGHDYRGLGGLLRVDPIKEAFGFSSDKIALSLPIADSALVALSLGNVEGYRGRDARLYLQFYDDRFRLVGDPIRRMTGKMEPVSIQREAARESGGSTGRIEMRLTRAGIDRSRKLEGVRLTDAQHRARFPSDTGLRYQRGLIEKPSLWLSKEFQKQ